MTLHARGEGVRIPGVEAALGLGFGTGGEPDYMPGIGVRSGSELEVAGYVTPGHKILVGALALLRCRPDGDYSGTRRELRLHLAHHREMVESARRRRAYVSHRLSRVHHERDFFVSISRKHRN